MQSRHKFGDYVIDVQRHTLHRGDREIHLGERAFAVLRLLAENAGRIVTRNELIDAVWRDVVVSDDSLARAVSDLRTALQDDASHSRYIRTVHRQGYVFIAPVTPVDDADTETMIGAEVRAAPRDPEVAPPPEPPGEVKTVTPAEIGLPEVALYLRVVPRTSRDEAGQLRVQYLTRMYPVPPDPNEPLPGPPGVPEEDDPELRLPGTTFHLRLVPQVYYRGETLDVHYRGSIHAMTQEAPPTRSTVTSPWGHDTGSVPVRAAAEAVHAAAPEDRYAAILDLITAMKGG